MSQHLIMIATGLVAFLVGRLTAWRSIRRLRAAHADATWRLGHDPLTGMFNRVGLYAAHTFAGEGDSQPMLILLIDLDDFKTVNDAHGHDVGDDLLVEIGDRITEAADLHSGIAARLSGDEFAVILPVRNQDLARIADLFVTTIGRSVELTSGDDPVKVTVTASVGAAIAETTDPLEDVALRRADIAMYRAKRHGGSRHVVYEPGMTMPDSKPRRGPRLRDLRQQPGGVTA